MSLWWRKHAEVLRDKMREVSHKGTITNGLGNAIKALQQHHIDTCLIYSDNLSDNVCYYLEAIFIHGLKDNFFEKVSTILANNSDKPPEPNFWPFLMVFSHKDVLSQVAKLSQIQTDVGRCRALIRIALNEGLLESYLSAMIQDKSTVRNYYRDYSYLRDPEQPDIMKKYIEGLRLFEFKLACNSRMLNVWSPTPLILSGIWSPPIVPEPVFTGIDAASFFDACSPSTVTVAKNTFEDLVYKIEPGDNTAEQKMNSACQTEIGEIESTASSVPSCPDPMPQLLYDEVIGVGDQWVTDQCVVEASHKLEDESVLSSYVQQADESLKEGSKDILDDAENVFFNTNENYDTESKVNDFGDSNQFSDDGIWPGGYSLGNRIIGRDSWSSSSASRDTNVVENEESTPDAEPVVRNESYQELLQNYSPARVSILRTPDFQELIGTSSVNTHVPYNENRRLSSSSSSFDDSDYEILPRNCTFLSSNADPATQNLVKIIGKISNEQGLDAQNYQCKFCSRPIGMIYGKARVCNYDGFCFCHDCHDNEEYYIPARIIHNWDFKKYKISKQTAAFFQQIEDEPLIDIRQLNPQLYSISSEMKELEMLRTQLSYLRSYLFTCRESVAEEMRRKLWPRDYLYEHIHLYSFKDLIQIPSHSLAQLLQKVVAFASKHVADCELCRQKGFICEVCGSPKVIYPFELGQIYRCEVCLAVYHSLCMSSSKRCPKCERIRKREDVNDGNWSIET